MTSERSYVRTSDFLMKFATRRDNPGVCVQLRVANVPGSIKDHPQGIVLHHLNLSDVCCRFNKGCNRAESVFKRLAHLPI